MRERFQSARRADNEGGFTLIELLVVIIILGILAAVVVFAVGGVGDKGQSAACKIDTRTIRTAEEAYSGSAAGNGNYTADEAVLVSSGFLSEPSGLHNVVLDPDPDGTGPLLAGFHLTQQTEKCGGDGAGGTNVGDTVNGTTSF